MDTFRTGSLALACLILIALPQSTLLGQITVEVGTGTLVNGQFQAPSPYANSNPGSRNQLLFLATELQAAGMTAGTISGLGFDVFAASGTTFQGFSISIGTTAATGLGPTWETGLGPASGPSTFTDQVGWTQHTFSTPFSWDGVSNVVIETCYANGTASQNAQVLQSVTTFTSCVSRNSPNPAICTDPGGTHVSWQQRPNVRFEWTPLEAPPVAVIATSSTFSCTGTVIFTDESLNQPTTWTWDFGDDSTSVETDPVHTYAASGDYVVTLIVTNPYGADTTELTITVDLSGIVPIAACAAASVGDVDGIGILDVAIEGVAHPSGDAVGEGYVDNTCQTVTVVQGTLLDLLVNTGTVASHAVRAWVDWDNTGTFTSNELLLSSTGPAAGSSTLVPAGAVLDIPLRLRVVAAYDLVTPDPQACGDVTYGQAEDYSITVVANTQPPVAIFSASPVLSCTGTVLFTDASLNTPTSWSWDFGDTGTSNEQHPQHTYPASGTYSVTLIATNANGQDDTLAVDLVIVDLEGQLVPASCAPNTVSYCCGYGLLGFQFAGINSSSPDGTEGYQDRSCGNVAQVEEGMPYAWSAITADETPQDIRIWIDMDNDGSFAASEFLATALDQVSPSGSVSIPSGVVFDTPVRVRVQCDVIGQSSAPCDAPLYGQTEDFSAIIAHSTAPPVAAFTAEPRRTCDGVVQFTDLSTHLPSGWAWDFGDSNTSTEQNPQHTYATYGTFTVILVSTNAFGSNTSTQVGYIQHVQQWQCDTLQLEQFDDLISTECLGVLADDGGPNGNYQQGTSGAFTISPPGAQFVTLSFSQFQWGNNPNRFLAIYDGPNTASPIIDQFSGNGLAQLPDNGVITSTGPSITLLQDQLGGGGPPQTSAGFLLTWNCSLTGIEELGGNPIGTIRPQPADDWFAIDLAPDPQNARTLSVQNAVGQIVEQHVVPATSTTIRIDASDYPGGIYLVHLTTATQHWSRTLIIR
ncbi:MAG: PKD domain-containing protein [Flavobacteriales bacterium]